MARSEATGQDAGQLRLDVGGDEKVGYRGPTVCKIVGITYRQLDYWARTELVTPTVREASGSGTQRLYSFDDVVQLRVVKRLLDTGVSLQRVRLAIDELRRRGRSVAEVTLVSDGSSVFAVDDNQQLIDLLQRGQGVFAIALGPVVEELKGEVTAFPTEPVEAADDLLSTDDVGAAAN
ncbi:MAG: MerR family transcriptional regulator [Actinomycetes bacterium]